MSTPAPRDAPRALLTAARLVSFAVICGVLYWGQAVLIPLALAALVTFLMSPLVTRLDRLGLPRVLAVIIVSGAVTGLVGGLGYVVVGELGELADELPAYRDNIREKVADLRAFTRGGTIERVQSTIKDISEDVQREAASTAPPGTPPAAAGTLPGATPTAAGDGTPVQVEIEPERPVLGNAELMNPLLRAIATIGLTLLLSVFMLVKREDLRNRIVSLAGQSSLVTSTKALAEAGYRISRYLLMQFVVNASYGLAVGIGLVLIGVPYAALWGLSAAVLRYIPYLGPWLAALLPLTVSVITAPGWEQVALVAGLFVTLEVVSNNVMEPWLYGQSVGLSSIAVIVSAIFWTWLWGPVGLILATPLTACLVVVSRYVPGLAVFDRLLSERPALQPHLWLYQRLLARDEDEAEDIIDEHLGQHSLAQTCDELLLGTLLALKHDLAAGRIAAADGDFVTSALGEIIDELPQEAAPAASPAAPVEEGPPLLLIGFPFRDRLDELALQLLSVLLRDDHCVLEILAPERLIGERIAEIETRRPVAVCVPSLPPGDLAATRHVCKRLRSRLPDLRLLVVRPGARTAPGRSAELLRGAGVLQVAASFEELREQVRRLVRDIRSPAQPEASPSAAEPSDPALAPIRQRG